MGKLLIVGVVLLLVITAYILRPDSEAIEPMRFSDVKAQADNVTQDCIADTDSLIVYKTDQDHMIELLTVQLNDVPAGTDVDIYFASYDGEKATGTGVYQDGYGSYNFSMRKDGDWKIVSFDACS